MGADHLLRDLDASQRRAVTSPARPLAILAPAGSGKTRVLTRRMAWRVATDDADPAHVLALTFTRKAAGELRDRLRALGLRDAVATGTFHGVAYAQLRTWWADQGRRPPALLPRKVRLLGEVLRGMPGGSLAPAQLATEIEWAKARLLGPHDYVEAARRARRRTPAPAQRVAALYARYEDAKRRERLVDFDDLLRLCTHLIETEPAFADAQRWRFRHLFVDEVQDVNPLQVRLLEAWRGQRYDLCVVGDPCQAIYGWNGADADYLQSFAAHYPTAEIVSLDHNYRSTPQVLAAAGDVLRAARTGGDPVQAVRTDGPPPRVERHRTDRDEARAIARAVRDRHGPGAAWSSQAVLARTNAQLPLIAEALRDAGVPHRVRGGDDLLGRPEVRRALDLLRQGDGPLAARLPDLAALADRYGPGGDADSSDPGAGLGGDADGPPGTGAAGAGSAGAGSAGAGSAGAGSAGAGSAGAGSAGAGSAGAGSAGAGSAGAGSAGAGSAGAGSAGAGATATGPAGEARASLELLVRLARDQLELDPRITAAGFVAWLSATFEAEAPDPGSDAVTLATFHAAKGLEWPVVHLAGVEDGFVPISHARTPADRAEEARLLYVAMTRAEDELRCTWAAQRSFGDQVVERQLCPWLAGLAERQRDRPATPPRPDGWQHRLAEERARLAAATGAAATPSADPSATGAARLGMARLPELAALRVWRDEAARVARIEPQTLVNDAVLEAIAAARPSTVDELAAVPGMGPLLAARVGDTLLAALAAADLDEPAPR